MMTSTPDVNTNIYLIKWKCICTLCNNLKEFIMLH